MRGDTGALGLVLSRERQIEKQQRGEKQNSNE